MRHILIFGAGVIAVVGLVGVAGYFDKPKMSETKDVAPQSAQSNPPVPTEVTQDEPKTVTKPITEGFATVSVTPWQLLKNPYMNQVRLVRLDPQGFPVIYNGNVLGYRRCNADPRICLQTGTLGLRLNRMFSANQALFDVIGQVVEDGANSEKLGELLVDLEYPAEAPPTYQDWVVMPEEPTRGTNAFGGVISVATVRFVRLANENDGPHEQAHTSPLPQSSSPLTTANASSPSEKLNSPCAQISMRDKENEKNFVEALQLAVSTSNSHIFSIISDFPLRVNKRSDNGIVRREMINAQALDSEMRNLFSPTAKKEILALDPSECLIEGEDGFMMDGGLIRFHRATDGQLKLIELNE
jgi:hypothetical protein